MLFKKGRRPKPPAVEPPEPPLQPGTTVLYQSVDESSAAMVLITALAPGRYCLGAVRTSDGARFGTSAGYDLHWVYKATQLLLAVLRKCGAALLTEDLVHKCLIGAEVDMRPSNQSARMLVEWFTNAVGWEAFLELRFFEDGSLPEGLRKRHRDDIHLLGDEL